jgi:hypothetical protein
MTGRSRTERILDAYLAPEADRLHDRVIEAALADIARTPQRRALRVPWRFPIMPAVSRATSIAAVALVALVGAGGVIYLANEAGGPGATTAPPTASPAATTAPTISTTAVPIFSFDPNTWTPYTSDVYGFTTAYPPGWRVEHAATRRWDSAVDLPIRAGVSPGIDLFINAEGSVAASVWRVAADVKSIENSRAALIAWAEEFCDATEYYAPCDGIAERAIPMCRERGDCHPDAIIVPFNEDVVAFFVGADDALTLAQVWRVDSDPEVAEYGGAVRLMQAFLEPMNVTVPGPGQGE